MGGGASSGAGFRPKAENSTIAHDDLTKDNDKTTANFIRLALPDHVSSGATDGRDTTQVFTKQFKKE